MIFSKYICYFQEGHTGYREIVLITSINILSFSEEFYVVVIVEFMPIFKSCTFPDIKNYPSSVLSSVYCNQLKNNNFQQLIIFIIMTILNIQC